MNSRKEVVRAADSAESKPLLVLLPRIHRLLYLYVPLVASTLTLKLPFKILSTIPFLENFTRKHNYPSRTYYTVLYVVLENNKAAKRTYTNTLTHLHKQRKHQTI